MRTLRTRYLLGGIAGVLAVAGVLAGLWAGGLLRADSGDPAAAREGDPATGLDGDAVVAQEGGSPSGDPLIFSWPAKFVCLEALQPGTVSFGLTAPVVQEKTEVLIHNPNEYPVDFYKKAVRARDEDAPPVAPGDWNKVTIEPDHAIRIDCDEIARLLTGNPSATFIGTYGIGVKVEGFVVIASGPQAVAGGPQRTGVLDVTAEYARGSEVLKKDFSYQPWWWWWWWELPWRLGYQYERILPVNQTGNIDCRSVLVTALSGDTAAMPDPQQQLATRQALQAGLNMDPTNVNELHEGSPAALVPLIGRCEKIWNGTTFVADIDYILVSNKGPSDADPLTGQIVYDTGAVYPWIPGKFYDLNTVIPNNKNLDMNDYISGWLQLRWREAGGSILVGSAMPYFFPWWCGHAFWGWWNGGDCIEIGVGEGESLDVEQVTPQRVLFSAWPPVP